MVMTNHHSTVRITENDLRTHINQFIHEEEAALEHLLMEEDAATSLGSHYEEHGKKVRSESWPRGIGKRHDGAVNKRIDDIMFLFWNHKVIVLYLYLHSQAAECIRNNAQILDRHILDAHTFATHCRHADERTYLNHIRQDAMLGTMQFINTHDGEQVAGDAADLSTHRIEQMAELLDIWFASCIINGGSALCQYRCHDDIGGTGNRSLIEQHIAALQLLCLYLINITLIIVNEVGSQILEAQEMSIQTATTYLIATRLSYGSLATSTEQRTYHEHTTTKRRTFLHKLQTVEIIEFQLITLECIVVTTVLGYLDTYLLEQLNQVVHIQDVRHVGDAHRFVGKDCGTDNLQRLVLGALRCDSTFERMTALYDKRLHKLVYYI